MNRIAMSLLAAMLLGCINAQPPVANANYLILVNAERCRESTFQPEDDKMASLVCLSYDGKTAYGVVMDKPDWEELIAAAVKARREGR